MICTRILHQLRSVPFRARHFSQGRTWPKNNEPWCGNDPSSQRVPKQHAKVYNTLQKQQMKKTLQSPIHKPASPSCFLLKKQTRTFLQGFSSQTNRIPKSSGASFKGSAVIQHKPSNQVKFVKCKWQKHHITNWNDDNQSYSTSVMIRHLL